MQFLAQTIVEYVAGEGLAEGTSRFVLPSYPSSVLLRIGREVEERFSRVIDRRIHLSYGIAYRLGQEWERSGDAADRANIEQARSRGWHNEGNNLTSLRNQVRDPDREDSLVVLVAGYDHIDDRASLRDFFHLNQRAVWEICLRRSFVPWVEARLRDVLDPDDGRLSVERIATALDALYDQGLADLPGISHYLEGLDMTGVASGSDAYRAVLASLGAFGLPRLNGLARTSRRTFASYIGPAQEFFNYGCFLDAWSRAKALSTLKAFQDSKPPQPDEETLGAFDSLEALLSSLRRYVEERSDSDRRKLLTADFVYVHDRVLGYRGRDPRPPRASTRRLRGLAPEVFLRALWLTLADYVRSAGEASVLPYEDLRGIELRSILFRHDFDAGAEGADEHLADRERARSFLLHLLGGVDDLLQRHVQIGGTEGQEPMELRSLLAPAEKPQSLEYQKTSVAEPGLKFVVVLSDAGGREFKREFLWALPQYHQSRLLVDLFEWARGEFARGANALPAFVVQYLPEVFLARSEDEVSRLLGIALSHEGPRMVDLLAAPGLERDDPLVVPLRDLSFAYQRFLRRVEEAGFFAALEDSYDRLRLAYTDAAEVFLRHSRESNLGPLLLKAFALLGKRDTAEGNWEWRPTVDAFAVTPLHPAVLDMLRHQHAFLCESFSVLTNDALRQPGRSRFAERHWHRAVDLARVERPLFGTLKGNARVLDSNVRSYGYVHLIGESLTPPGQLATRLLLEYDEEDDEDLTDTELFRETRASQLVRDTLLDYRRLYAHADDGLSVGAFCGREVQPVIAGIDSYLEAILDKRDERPYGLQVTVFSAGRDDSSVTRWLNAWRDRWQEAELTTSRRHYGNCRISIAYRVVSEAGRPQFERMVQDTALDLVFFTDFVRSSASRFEALAQESPPDDGFRQFPVLEKACCVVSGGGWSAQRERIVSHRRFTLATLHAEVMARLSLGYHDPERRHAIISHSDFLPWGGVLDAAHRSSAWVVCIDPSVDEQLLRRAQSDGSRKREIIGFGTGVGAHGENNYTVSTEQFAIADVKRLISSQLATRLGPWDPATRERVAESLVAEASGMAGLSVVKATGPSEYVRDYIAYATVRKLLPRDTTALCDELISLDAFGHWFDDAEERTRPDLLRLRARIVDGHLQIAAQVFECKLAQQSESYLSEARSQVEAGLRRLIGCFRPRQGGRPVGIDDRPDQRYWWMQLHRLIASRGRTTMPRYAATLSALERLSEGFFSIAWQGAVVAIWTDLPDGALRRETKWTIEIEKQQLVVPALSAGGELVRRVCLEGAGEDVLAGVEPIAWSYRQEPLPPRPDLDAASDGDDHEPSPSVEPPAPPPDRPMVVRVNPRPGSDDELTTSDTRHVPERILLGTATTGGRAVYWEFEHPELPNRHILVFGASGTGKTYTIQALLLELARAGRNALIVDYTGGFTTSQLESAIKERLRPRQHIVRREPLPVNPFRQQTDLIDDEPLEEEPTITAQRVTGVFSEVYQLGDQQKSALYRAIRDGIEHEGAAFTLTGLVDRLEGLRLAGGPVANSAASVLSRIQPFVDMKPFGQEDAESWERLYTDEESRCHILQLAGFSKDIARLLTEFSLIDLYRYYRTRGSKDQPRVIVLDEIQNLDHRIESPLGQLLTEGRKFGISLVLATQTLSNLERDERDRLFQASHKLFFKPADTELRSFAAILESATGERADEWVRRLSALSRGECYSLGPARQESAVLLEMKRSFRIRITPLGERLANGPSAS